VSDQGQRTTSTLLGIVGIAGLGAIWELIKFAGGGKKLFAISTDDSSMPHISSVIAAFTKEDVRGSGNTVGEAVLAGAWFSLRLAVAGFVLGSLIGLFLAIVMQRFKLVERAWLPYVVLSQTVPLIALAPLIVGLGLQIRIGDHQWPTWMSVVGMSAYLCFFPVTIGALRGLQSPKPHSLELMDSYAAGWWKTLTKLRFPSAIPHLMPALKLAAAASVVGAVVAEISAGLKGGVGRLIIDYFQTSSGDPSRVFTAFVAAAGLGLLVAGSVSVLERFLNRNRPAVTS
jgi:NitT/TauT family transport system permease protein